MYSTCRGGEGTTDALHRPREEEPAERGSRGGQRRKNLSFHTTQKYTLHLQPLFALAHSVPSSTSSSAAASRLRPAAILLCQSAGISYSSRHLLHSPLPGAQHFRRCASACLEGGSSPCPATRLPAYQPANPPLRHPQALFARFAVRASFPPDVLSGSAVFSACFPRLCSRRHLAKPHSDVCRCDTCDPLLDFPIFLKKSLDKPTRLLDSDA